VTVAMVANIQLPKTQLVLHRVFVASDADFSSLEIFVTERTNSFFKVLSKTGITEPSTLLMKDRESWEAGAS